MAMRTMGVRQILGNPSHQPDDLVDLSALDGLDLLDEFEDWIRSVPAEHFVDSLRKTYGHTPKVTRYGRMVLVEMKTGPYAAVGAEVIKISTHITQHENAEDDASTIPTRCALLIPPGSKYGLFFAERQGHENCGKRILESFVAHIQEKRIVAGRSKSGGAAHLVLKTPSLLRADAWLDAANLQEISLVRHDHVGDVASESPLIGTPVTYVSQILPEKGNRWLPRRLLDLLRDDPEAALRFLSADDIDTEGVDSVIVTVGDGEQQKKFEVGKTRTPAVRLVLNGEGQPMLSDKKLVAQIEDEAKRHFEHDLELQWDYSWTRASQSTKP